MTTLEAAPPPAKSKPSEFNHYPFWTPRFWHGMEVDQWLRLCAEHRFRIHPLRWSLAATITGLTTFNWGMNRVQRLFYEKSIRETQITEPPVFILGHWRSGTTHLHELLVLDERFAYPTTYQCFAPRHFFMTEWLMTGFFGWLMPSRRPMDNMEVGWSHPQEDEFALVAMGLRSPYLRMAFCNDPPPHMDYFDMRISDEERRRWQEGLVWFVKALTLHTPKRMVLKSPPHTGRVAAILEVFPDARFIHITREPYSLFSSTMRVWEGLDRVQSLQVRKDVGREEFVFSAFERMYRGFEEQRGQIDPSRIVDIRYEDLVRNTVGEVQAIYEQLDLGPFEPVQPRLVEYLSKQKAYKPNRHVELSPEIKAEIDRRWAPYISKYGYA